MGLVIIKDGCIVSSYALSRKVIMARALVKKRGGAAAVDLFVKE